MSEKILFVDDEPNVLSGIERQLRKRYTVQTAPGGEEGLAAITSAGPFAVIVSDMRMPGMNGAQFLAEARRRQPDSVRMLLTGFAEVQSAIDAVNNGALFRFLTKPCDNVTLVAALDDALAQYRLVTAERDLLDRTLRGSVQVLGEVLAMVNPTAFGRALRVQQLVRELASVTNTTVGWEVEVAAILSQLGYVAVSERVLSLADRGKDLSAEEQSQLDTAPKLAADLIGRIPRLERVIEIITHLGQRYDDSSESGKLGSSIPLGARLLRIARDFDVLHGRGIPRPQVVEYLKANPGQYDPILLDGFDQLVRKETQPVSRVVSVNALKPGMILEDNLHSIEGTLLLRQRNTITLPLKMRLETMAASGQILPTLRVLVPVEG